MDCRKKFSFSKWQLKMGVHTWGEKGERKKITRAAHWHARGLRSEGTLPRLAASDGTVASFLEFPLLDEDGQGLG